MIDVFKYNSRAWDNEAENHNEWTIPVGVKEIAKARTGKFSVVLTPNKPVPRDWFPNNFVDKNVLCLASAGGQQAPIFAALGANVTSFDASEKQLGRDRFVAERDSLQLGLEQGDAADLSRFEDESFDLVFHPVSNCFIKEIQPVWNEAYRVLKKQGVLLSGFDNGFFFIFDHFKSENEGKLELRFSLPYSDETDLTDEELAHIIEQNQPLEYGHTLEQQIGGQISAGFVITGFYEDEWNNEATELNKYCSTFIATRAVKL
ncbi:MAG: class I SAM-dependent methyltransferase [Pyrinomonadaceae bacterium]